VTRLFESRSNIFIKSLAIAPLDKNVNTKILSALLTFHTPLIIKKIPVALAVDTVMPNVYHEYTIDFQFTLNF